MTSQTEKSSGAGLAEDSSTNREKINGVEKDSHRKKKDTSRRIYKLVLTGGPCAGKTTGQNRLSDFFENLGWKVFRAPETATVLMQGGIKFPELSQRDAFVFQCDTVNFNEFFDDIRIWTLGSSLENLIKTMLAIENTYFDIAETCPKNCIVICDRGIMDATAFISLDEWDIMCKRNGWNSVDLRDNRYDQVIHLVSAAKGAEEYYTTEEHTTRSEDVSLARMRDDKACAAWVGHPYFDIVDNSTSFEAKVVRMMNIVCMRMGIDVGDRLMRESKKRKFLVAIMPSDNVFPDYQDFEVIHDYLSTPGQKTQARLRKRGQHGSYTYMHTIRRHLEKIESTGEQPELKQAISRRDYIILLAQKDQRRSSIYKKRRCFTFNNHYYQLDVYLEPCPASCRGLILLETYTADASAEFVSKLPSFLNVLREVTGDPQYSMYNLALKDEVQEMRDIRRRIKSEGGPQLMNQIRNARLSTRTTSLSSNDDTGPEDLDRLIGTTPEQAVGSSAPNLSNGTSIPDEDVNCNQKSRTKGGAVCLNDVVNHAMISSKKVNFGREENAVKFPVTFHPADCLDFNVSSRNFAEKIESMPEFANNSSHPQRSISSPPN